MACLRLDPNDYATIARICQSLKLADYSLPTFRQFLQLCLAECFPALGGRVAALGRRQFQLLYNHFRARPSARRPHGLTGAEVEAVLAAGVPLLGHARFAGPLKRALVRHLAEWHAALALKVERLSLAQFEDLCAEVRGPSRDEA